MPHYSEVHLERLGIAEDVADDIRLMVRDRSDDSDLKVEVNPDTLDPDCSRGYLPGRGCLPQKTPDFPTQSNSSPRRPKATSHHRASTTTSPRLLAVGKKRASMSPTCPVHFDYDKDWHLVVPHLSDPYLQRFLDAQLGDYVREHMAFMTYIPGTPPWTWTLADHHYDKAAERAKQSGQMDGLYREFGFTCPHAFHEALEVDEDLEQRCRDRIDEIEAPFLPQPGSVAFYQVWNACHWMAPFFTLVAQRAVPNLIWTTLGGPYHSTTVGRRSAKGSGSRTIMMVFDPLRPKQPADEIIRDVRMK
jgi:hypothetical protein